MAGNQSITNIKKASQEAIVHFTELCRQQFQSQWDYRSKFEEIDKLYHREKDLTEAQIKAKIQNMYGNSSAYQNLTIPVVMPQVEAAVTYQASVFLQGNPIFGVVAPPKHVEAGMQLETIIDDQAIKGGWLLEFEKLFRDGFKYNLGMAEVSWDSKVVPAVETTTAGTKPTSVRWEGNKVRRLDPYNTFFDTRVPPAEVPERGEFAGFIERITKTELKTYLHSLDSVLPNASAAFESNAYNYFYDPQVVNNTTPDTNRPSQAGNFNWLKWANLAGAEQKIAYKDTYEKTTIYARIIPSEFNIVVPAPNTPQVWKFVIINSSVVVYAERLTNAHNLLPVFFLQPYDDGLTFQTKSLAQNVEPMQTVSSSLMNSVLAARRRSIYDRTVYDPTLISSKDINSPNPIANIPVRPAAYGSDIRQSFAQMPFNDNQSGLVLGEVAQITTYADAITGQNKAQQGQFVKGNKTQHEYSDVMANANSRSQAISLVLESQFFTPLKEVLKINILQYQGGTSLFSRNVGNLVKIDPVAIRKAVLAFKLSDGLLPTDKLLNHAAFQTALQVLGSSPTLAAPYNLGALVSYLFKSQGADIEEFEKSTSQQNYERAVEQWQQTAMQVAQKGQPFNVPMPTPEQYGWKGETTEVEEEEEVEETTVLEKIMKPQEAGEQQ